MFAAVNQVAVFLLVCLITLPEAVWIIGHGIRHSLFNSCDMLAINCTMNTAKPAKSSQR